VESVLKSQPKNPIALQPMHLAQIAEAEHSTASIMFLLSETAGCVISNGDFEVDLTQTATAALSFLADRPLVPSRCQSFRCRFLPTTQLTGSLGLQNICCSFQTVGFRSSSSALLHLQEGKPSRPIARMA
jgi:hypothetical protein